MLRFYKTTFLSLLLMFILPGKMSNSLWRSDVPLFIEFINILSNAFYKFTELLVFLHTFLVIFFAWYKEYMSYLISFRKLLDVFPANIHLDEDVFRRYLQKTCSKHLQDVLIKTNIFPLVIRLQKMSSRHLQDILIKTNIFPLVTRLQKTSSRRFD